MQKELQEGEGLREERRKASKGRKENSFSLLCIMLGGRKHGDFSLKSLLNKESFPNSLPENPQVWEVYGRTVSSKQMGKSESHGTEQLWSERALLVSLFSIFCFPAYPLSFLYHLLQSPAVSDYSVYLKLESDFCRPRMKS